MFSIHGKLFLALEKVRLVKITASQVPTAQYEKSPKQNLQSSPFHWQGGFFPYSLLLFAKPGYSEKNNFHRKVEFNLELENKQTLTDFALCFPQKCGTP